MPRIITKELAKKIVKKLRASKGTDGAHRDYEVWFDDQIIAHVTLRHGSSKEQGHDHIPDDIHVGPGFAKLLGQCTKSYEDWIQELRDKGIIEDVDPEDQNAE